jgi:hypothetical protein
VRVERKWAVRGAITLVLAAAIVWSASPVSSRSSGIDMTEAGTGCTCHSPTENGAANVTFRYSAADTGHALANLYYEPGKKYTVHLAYDDAGVPMNASPTANHGGFLVHASGGKFALNDNSSGNVSGTSTPFVQLKDTDTSVTHTNAGDVNGYRSFSFDWIAPADNNSNVVFDIFVNAVNGDGTNTADDHWTKASAVLPGKPGAGGATVDISKLGVPLRAYWLGVIGILSTIFLLILSFYVIRSGSKFYEFGLPRGQVKSVKIRTIPAPKTRGSYAVMTGLIIILIVIVITFLSIRDEQLDTMQATGFLMAVVFVIALTAAYYIRAFLPLVDVLEEETIEPLK